MTAPETAPETVPTARTARPYLWPWVFVVLNAVVWGNRIKLGEGQMPTVLVALTFLVPALVLAVALVWRKALVAPVVAALALWTILYWPVKLVNIALHDHPVPFVVVHVVLGVVSVAVAGMALRAVLRPGARVAAATS